MFVIICGIVKTVYPRRGESLRTPTNGPSSRSGFKTGLTFFEVIIFRVGSWQTWATVQALVSRSEVFSFRSLKFLWWTLHKQNSPYWQAFWKPNNLFANSSVPASAHYQQYVCKLKILHFAIEWQNMIFCWTCIYSYPKKCNAKEGCSINHSSRQVTLQTPRPSDRKTSQR